MLPGTSNWSLVLVRALRPRLARVLRGLGAPVALRLAAGLATAAALAGCASGHAPPPVVRAPAPAPPPPPLPPPPAVAAEDSLSEEEARDLSAVQEETFKEPVGSTNADLDADLERFLKEESDALLTERVDYDIPIVINQRVEYYIDYFQNRVANSFAKWLARAPQVVPYMREAFRQAGLPEDLIYVSMIESGFSPLAASRSKAVGYWQFVTGTARRYGLRVDRWVDERRDLEKSTRAAIAYLKDLHQMFGSWYLAAAAYNSGEGRIQRAIEKYRSENLWELAEFSYLRTETKDYVPKLIAATLIAKEPDKYGFLESPDLPLVAVDTVTVPGQTDLRVIAAAAGTTTETIRALNPNLRSYATPPEERDYRVLVPRGGGMAFSEILARVPVPKRSPEQTHVVRRGETPNKIARRYGVTTAALMAENGIRNPRGLRAGQRLRIPGTGRDEDIQLPAELARLREEAQHRAAHEAPDGEAPTADPAAVTAGAGGEVAAAPAPGTPAGAVDAAPDTPAGAGEDMAAAPAPGTPAGAVDTAPDTPAGAGEDMAVAPAPGRPAGAVDAAPGAQAVEAAETPDDSSPELASPDPSMGDVEAANPADSVAPSPTPDLASAESVSAPADAGSSSMTPPADDTGAPPGAPDPGVAADSVTQISDRVTTPVAAETEHVAVEGPATPSTGPEPAGAAEPLAGPNAAPGKAADVAPEAAETTGAQASESAGLAPQPSGLDGAPSGRSDGEIRYAVRRGDTLYRIALDHDLTIAELRRLNPSLGQQIYPGQILLIRKGEATETSGPVGASEDAASSAAEPADGSTKGVVLEVQPGDTVVSIARLHDVTPEQVRRWNGLAQGEDVKTGERLVIFPGASPLR